MRLAILGGGGVRMPAFVHALVSSAEATFDEVVLFEPDSLRRATTGRLCCELAAALREELPVRLTDDAEEALSGVDFVFSAIRVGGDAGRVIDEQVAIRRGLVGQETTGPGGCAMALRTIPVVLDYCRILERCSPGAVLVNFTNPAGVITQAIAGHSAVRAVGVCDTPSGAIARLGAFLGAGEAPVSWSYAGLNHLGWISSYRLDGEERIGELLARYEELQRFDHRFAGLDAALVRRVGAIPTEYVFYYYDPRRFVDQVARAGSSRGEDVARLNEELLAGLAEAFAGGGLAEAWATYSTLMGVRRDTYMRTDVDGASGQGAARSRRAHLPPPALAGGEIGGYEGIALRVIGGLRAGRPGPVIVNTTNRSCLDFLEPADVVEVPALVHPGGIAPLAVERLPGPARALVAQVKEYERAVVEAAVGGDAGLAALALALNPLVPGVSVARELLEEYRERHGPLLAHLR